MMAGGRVFPPMRNSDQHDNGGPSPSDITQWLSTRKGEDSAALGKLLPLVYGELHRQAVRAFSGLSIEETAEVMGVSPRTIVRQWQTAKAWLYREIRAA